MSINEGLETVREALIHIVLKETQQESCSESPERCRSMRTETMSKESDEETGQRKPQNGISLSGVNLQIHDGKELRADQDRRGGKPAQEGAPLYEEFRDVDNKQD